MQLGGRFHIGVERVGGLLEGKTNVTPDQHAGDDTFDVLLGHPLFELVLSREFLL